MQQTIKPTADNIIENEIYVMLKGNIAGVDDKGQIYFVRMIT